MGMVASDQDQARQDRRAVAKLPRKIIIQATKVEAMAAPTKNQLAFMSSPKGKLQVCWSKAQGKRWMNCM